MKMIIMIASRATATPAIAPPMTTSRLELLVLLVGSVDGDVRVVVGLAFEEVVCEVSVNVQITCDDSILCIVI